MTTILTGGRVVDPGNDLDAVCDVLIDAGVIAAVVPSVPTNADRRIDCAGCVITPGLIDIHVHLRQPGFEYKEDIASGLRSALHGGFTGVCPMPNTNPVSDSRPDIEFLVRESRRLNTINLWPIGAVTRNQDGKQLTEFGDLQKGGAVALSDDGRPISDSNVLRRAMEYASKFGLPIMLHCEDLGLSGSGSMHEGAVSARLGLIGIPCAAESAMVARDIQIAAFTGGQAHVCHVSCAASVALIRMAKAQGIGITAETAPHYFHLTDEAVDNYNTRAKMYPPLRGEEDVAAVREGLRDGTLEIIATDHAPHAAYEKDVQFEAAPNGITGLETALPLCLDLVRSEVLTWRQLVSAMATRPAQVIGVDRGNLSLGAVADVTVIDPEQEWTYSAKVAQSKSLNSPFLDRPLRGKARHVFVGGRQLIEQGRICD